MILVKSQLNAKFFKKAQAFQDPQGFQWKREVFQESARFVGKANSFLRKPEILRASRFFKKAQSFFPF